MRRGARTYFERGGKGNSRLTVHFDRVRDPTPGDPEARAELLGVLRSLVAEIENGRTEPAVGSLPG